MDDTISSFGTFASPVKPNSRLNDFKILCKLGEGSFSTVYKVQRLTDNKIYAMKKVLMSRLNDKEKGNSLNEIRILASIRSDHIIEYRDSFFDDSSDSLCIVMEYAGEGDLLSKLKEYKEINQKLQEESGNDTTENQPESENTEQDESDKNSRSTEKNKRIYKKLNQEVENLQSKRSSTQGESLKSTLKENKQQMVYMEEEMIWDYFLQCLKGLKCLHDMKILHRDLKCANIFIGAHNIIKIGDLNVSKVTQRPEQLAKTQTGTPYYTAPEVWKGLTYNHKSDVWSLGCIIYELSAQKHPFKGNTIEGLFTNIMKGQYERIPAFYSDELAFVINQCLLQNPKLRPGCDQLLKLPAFVSRMQKYEDKYRQYFIGHHKQRTHIQNHLTVPGQNNLEFTPQRAQRTNTESHHLIDTINVPSNMKQLSALLPKSNYEDTPILLPSISEFDENMINNNLQHNRSNFAKQRASMEKISEFEQLEKISSVDSSSNTTSPQATTRFNQKSIDNLAQQNEQKRMSLKQDNIFQTLLDLQSADILHHPSSKNFQQKQEVKPTLQIQEQNYHHLVYDSPIRLTLQKVHMDENAKQISLEEKGQQQVEPKHIFLQKVELSLEQKNNSGVSQNNNTKNSISTNAQTFKHPEGSNNKKESHQNSQQKNTNGITSRGSPNISLIENTSCQEKPQIINSQNSSIDQISNYMKKLKMRPNSSALRSSKTVDCQTNSNNSTNINLIAPHPSQSNLEINQQQTLISEETYPKFVVPSIRYSQYSSNIEQTQSTNNEEDLQFNKKMNNNGYYNDVRNYRIRYTRQGSKETRVKMSQKNVNNSFNNYNNHNNSFNNNYNNNVNNSFNNNNNYYHNILKSEEDCSSYSPTIFSRGMVVPYSAVSYDKNSRVSTIISSTSQQPRRPPSSGNNQSKKSSSPSQRVAQFTQLMKRYLPKAVLKNGVVVLNERNNSSTIQNNHKSPVIHPAAPNSAKYPSHKIAAAAAFNSSLISQLNNNSFNSNNYSFNNQNSPPIVNYNKENINTANILNNSFGFTRHQARQNIYKGNENYNNSINTCVRAVQYEKNVFSTNNNNHIQIVKKIGNVNNIMTSHSHSINRSSPPKRINGKESSSRRNIFYHPHNMNNFNQYVNTSIVNRVAYNNYKNTSSKMNTSSNEGNSQERKQIRQIIR